MRMEEGAIRTSGEGVSTRNAEHGMTDYTQREGGNERTWLMGIVGMERPCITLKAGRRRWRVSTTEDASYYGHVNGAGRAGARNVTRTR